VARPKRLIQIRIASKLFPGAIKTQSLDHIRLEPHLQVRVVCHRCPRRVLYHSASLCLLLYPPRRRLHSSSSCFPSSNMLPWRVLVYDRRFLNSSLLTEVWGHGWRCRLGVGLHELARVDSRVCRRRGRFKCREVLLRMLLAVRSRPHVGKYSYHQVWRTAGLTSRAMFARA
jgi:hypothetical protein